MKIIATGILLAFGAAKVLSQTFTTYEGGPAAESAWRAAAGGPQVMETFEGYLNHQLIASIPSLHLNLEVNEPFGYPSTYFDSSQHRTGPMNLGNFNSATFAGQFADMVIHVDAGYVMTAFAFWNTDPQGNYVVSAYDSNGNLLGTVSAQTFWTFESFAGFVSSVPVATLVFDGNMGDGWNHIDDVQSRTYASGSAFVSGAIELGDYDPDEAGQEVVFEMSQGGVVMDTQTVTLGEGGTYSFATPVTGVTAIAAKGSHWLRAATAPGLIAPGSSVTVNFSLVNGDGDGDNEVAIGDYAILSSAYGSGPGDPNWDPLTDFNGDEAVDIGDYAILSSHFGESGD